MNVTFEEVTGLPVTEPDETVFYGDSAQQFAELRLPECEPEASIILIHGGCWQNAYDLGYVRPMADALKASGYLVWSIEYRRIGDEGACWPGTFEDVGRAVDQFRAIMKKRNLTNTKKIFMGHSAGGNLALWAAARANFSNEHPLAIAEPLKAEAVIGLAAITDLRRYAAGKSECEQAVVELLGLPAEHDQQYAATSPVELLPSGVPTILLQGSEDTIVRREQAQRFHDAANACGDLCSIEYIPGAGHFDLVHPGTLAWRIVLASVSSSLIP